ncbi:MAG: YHS domain-containing protein [Candidatus Saccharicenans sp.]|nr:YHS domain-containing protein [Candidatus Saccharicenans sp.]MDI6849608.1 YHS domain-containing protein [Candidatus Saccharicenans sp.]
MFIRLIFLFLLFYLVFLVVRFFQSLGQSIQRKNAGPDSLPKKTMVKDEVCNTYIPVDEALKENRNGRVYYFCSEDCRKKFLASGEKFD